jgi:CRP-like cAMP-binding protein
MTDAGLLRLSRELFLAAFGVQQRVIDSWVIDRLTSLLDEEDVQAGQVLWNAGEPLEFIYFVRNGSVQLTRVGAAPWTFQGRSVLGGFEVHLERPLTRSATALNDFQAMKVRPNAWLELLEDSFFLARASVRFCAATVARLEERVPAGLPTSSTERLATVAHRSSAVIERLAFLADVEILRGAGVQPLAELAASSSEGEFRRGERLFEPSHASRQIWVVVEGEVHATRCDAAGTWRYGPGEVVCGAASIEGPPVWEATAAIATRVISFPIEAWFELMDEHFDLMRAVSAALALRREALLDHLAGQSGGIVLP